MIALDHIKGQTIAVLGLGASGMATMAAARAAGARVFGWDDDAGRRDAAAAQSFDIAPPATRNFGRMISSPGIPMSYPQPHPDIAAALALDKRVDGDIQLFAEARGGLPAHKVAGITGSNGKSTATALLAHLLNGAGISALIGGNFGPPVLALDPVQGVYVLELSSFQLEQTSSLACDIAIFLNLSPDHQDRYADMNAYFGAKAAMFEMQGPAGIAVVGIDDAYGRQLADRLSQRVLRISGTDHPDADIRVQTGPGGRRLVGENLDIALPDQPALAGVHNAQNAAAAVAAALELSASRDDIARSLKSFGGLAHRSQHVAQAGAIAFINDSKATNIDAAAKALGAFQSIHWLAGGSNKGSDFTLLGASTSAVRRAYFFGETAASLRAALPGIPADIFATMAQAMDAAVRDAAQEGEGQPATILLSPACASFDQFANFAARGDAFAHLARAHAARLKESQDVD